MPPRVISPPIQLVRCGRDAQQQPAQQHPTGDFLRGDDVDVGRVRPAQAGVIQRVPQRQGHEPERQHRQPGSGRYGRPARLRPAQQRHRQQPQRRRAIKPGRVLEQRVARALIAPGHRIQAEGDRAAQRQHIPHTQSGCPGSTASGFASTTMPSTATTIPPHCRPRIGSRSKSAANSATKIGRRIDDGQRLRGRSERQRGDIAEEVQRRDQAIGGKARPRRRPAAGRTRGRREGRRVEGRGNSPSASRTAAEARLWVSASTEPNVSAATSACGRPVLTRYSGKGSAQRVSTGLVEKKITAAAAKAKTPATHPVAWSIIAR